MACFLVSAAEAVVVSAVNRRMELTKAQEKHTEEVEVVKIPVSVKLKWLTRMLTGGSFLLAFEHVWHGEVTAWFPFLTAMSSAADRAEMFKEMATVGVGMAILITAVWGAVCVAADAIIKRSSSETKIESERS